MDRRFAMILWPVALAAAGVSCQQTLSHREAAAQRAPGTKTRLPGAQPDGSILLPNQWSLRPAGTQIELRDFPANIAVHPGGRFVAVLHNGYSAHQISVVDLPAQKTVSH